MACPRVMTADTIGEPLRTEIAKLPPARDCNLSRYKQGFEIAHMDNALLRTDDGGSNLAQGLPGPARPLARGPDTVLCRWHRNRGNDGSIYIPDGDATAAILQTTDAGKSWTKLGSFKGICGADHSVSISALSFPDRQHGWAALDCGPQPQPLYRTSDGGKTWQALMSSGALGDRLKGVSFVDQQTGYLVTEAGRLFRTIDAGTTFAPVDNLAVHTPSLRFVTKDLGWELRGPQLFETRDGGNNWQLLDLGYHVQEFSLLPNGQAPSSLHRPSGALGPPHYGGYAKAGAKANGQAWVVIGGRASAENPNPARRFLALQPGGQTWIEYQLGAPQPGVGAEIPSNWRDPELDSIQFADALHGWLRADTALYYTADGGRSWTQFH